MIEDFMLYFNELIKGIEEGPIYLGLHAKNNSSPFFLKESCCT